jgi:type II secretory pathway pseudopilin PulG
MAFKVRRAERGVSLLDSLIALAILAFVAVAVIAGVLTAVKSNELARTRIIAESLARSELEYVNVKSPVSRGEWVYTLPGGPYPAWDAAHNSLPLNYSGYSITVSSDIMQEPNIGSLNKITAVVYYVDDEVLTDDEVISIETRRFEDEL